jgi:hypothetical protein
LDARPQGVEIEKRAEVLFDGPDPGDDFIDGSQIGAMCLVERWQRPRLRPQPRVVTLRPSLFGRGKPAAMPQEKFREPWGHRMSAYAVPASDALATTPRRPSWPRADRKQ